MRRTLFGRSPEVELPTATRASAKEALWFDVHDHSESAALTLAERRVGAWAFSPWLLLCGHVAIVVSLFIGRPPQVPFGALASALLPLAGSLALDTAAGVMMLFWRRLQLAPHTVVRIMCGYLAATGGLWTTASVAAGSVHLADPAFVTEAMAAGFFLRSVVAVPSPPLAVVNALVAFVTTLLFSGNVEITVSIDALALLMVGYSIIITEKTLFAGRRRLALEWQARKALNFVDEFENSGRGWFWETDPMGTLSYVSRQLAEDFQCEPEALLGRRFTDLLSVDQASEALEERKTLGFHLSARFPFSDVVVRPASEQDVHWSLSGNPIFDERGRFLGFRGIGTDLTEQRKSEREI
jgi:PAS domain-containing protein